MDIDLWSEFFAKFCVFYEFFDFLFEKSHFVSFFVINSQLYYISNGEKLLGHRKSKKSLINILVRWNLTIFYDFLMNFSIFFDFFWKKAIHYSFVSLFIMDSDGNCISVLEKLLGHKKVKRSFCRQYLSCFFAKNT